MNPICSPIKSNCIASTKFKCTMFCYRTFYPDYAVFEYFQNWIHLRSIYLKLEKLQIHRINYPNLFGSLKVDSYNINYNKYIRKTDKNSPRKYNTNKPARDILLSFLFMHLLSVFNTAVQTVDLLRTCSIVTQRYWILRCIKCAGIFFPSHKIIYMYTRSAATCITFLTVAYAEIFTFWHTVNETSCYEHYIFAAPNQCI